ncbi:pantoate--beta-alanine ligase [Pseudoxanthomonas wuyuanensis]|uniref:Pantothenate synthetase n=1 Tax=Pseudoxanthomonas wuyuanensis TaxID=1073196 RepID=A0A286D9C7_9GAMM|nr:pantoate--beta-alanine ligase [Pseudoxanthomonas wuyuanensis]KAF1722034.1 pantoate--beta-alanine ligase [Pseudoxanthomonas wuyuanensis]SOD55227.1 pantothenate synthetase [Pseudoxanthomonas wuyuanensis]
MIETITELELLRARVTGWKRQGLRVALVPTMGNLHAGHYSLVMLARQYADRVVSSVFVNPTQFGPNEDFTRYPRTPEADTSGLEGAGCDALWLPTVESMYPFGVELAAKVHVPGVSSLLEGAHRPGHFDGVCTVVSRLFNQVQPDVAAFGKKDFQQLAVIRQMVRDLAFPVEILAGSIVRESDGLAMSSRNQYLAADERPRAAAIRRTLLAMREGIVAATPRAAVEAAAARELAEAGFVVDYSVVRRPDLSEPADGETGPRVALIAARLGKTRLIDNLEW